MRLIPMVLVTLLLGGCSQSGGTRAGHDAAPPPHPAPTGALAAPASAPAPPPASAPAPVRGPTDALGLELRALRDAVRNKLVVAALGMRMVRGATTPTARKAAMDRGIDLSRKVAAVYEAFPAKQPEVKKMTREAAAAWKGFAAALEKAAAVKENEADRAKLQGLQTTIQAAQQRVDHIMKEIAQASAAHGA